MSNTAPIFPPPGFHLIARAPDMWEPADRDVIVGYPSDVRRDVIGILLCAPYPSGKGPGDMLYIETKREEIQGIGSLLTAVEHPTEKDPRDPSKPREMMMVNKLAIQWVADLEAYHVAMEASDAVDLQAVLTKLVAEKTAAMATANAAPVPATAPTNSSTPTPEVAPAATTTAV